MEVDEVGFNLHWPALDVDLYVPALVSGIFGTRAWMTSELARLAGKATSPAKAAAARSNGAKGGRPRKAAHVGENLGGSALAPLVSSASRASEALARYLGNGGNLDHQVRVV